MSTRAWMTVAAITMGAGLALGQDKPKTDQPTTGFPPAVNKDDAPKPVVASDAKAAVEAAVKAMTAAKWVSYTAKVEGMGMPGEFTAKVVLERADAGGWKISMKGQQKNKSSGKSRPVEVAFDGANIRSLRDLDKQVGQLSDPADVEETMLFFAKEKAAAPIAWETLDKEPFEFLKMTPHTLEAAVDVEGEKCNVIRAVSKDAKPAGEGADAFTGVYYISIKDGMLRRIERVRPNAKPGDKPVRTVTFTEVSVSEEAKGGDFAIQVPKGYTVKTEAGKKALKPMEKAKEETAKAPEKAGAISPGNPAPAFDLKDPEGNAIKSENYKDKIVVLDFWGVWCHWCVKAMPQIQKVHEAYKDKDVVIIGVNCNEPAKNDPKKFMAENHYTYTLALKGESVAKAYQVAGYPFLCMIYNGKIVWTHSGYSDNLEKEMSAQIDKVLAEKKK